MTEAGKELLDRCNERDDLLTVFNRLKDSKLDKLLEQTQLVGDVIKNVNQWMALVDKLQDLDQKRFDEAQGIVDAYKNIGHIPVPIIVRLQGTNAVEAKKLIDDSGLNVHSAVLLQEAADKVKEVLA